MTRYKHTKWFLLVLVVTLLTGCWDQRQFKNIKIVLVAGFDKYEKDQITTTVTIPSVKKGGSETLLEESELVSSNGTSLRQTRAGINRKISRNFDTSKVLVLVYGKELVKKDLYPILDVLYRNPKSNLNSKLAVVDGLAKDVISLEVENEPRVSNYINGLLEGMISSTHAPNNNLQIICAELLEPGQDFGLPFISIEEENNLLNYEGLALFHEEVYTGENLSPEETLLYLLMKNQKAKQASITTQVSNKYKRKIKNFITVDVAESNSKIRLSPTNDHGINVNITLDLKVRVDEYPANKLDKKEKIKKLDQKLSERVTEDAEKLIEKIQLANSDLFGIGRRVQGFHPDIWEKLDWNKAYPTIQINPKVNIHIVQKGILN